MFLVAILYTQNIDIMCMVHMYKHIYKNIYTYLQQGIFFYIFNDQLSLEFVLAFTLKQIHEPLRPIIICLVLRHPMNAVLEPLGF